MAYETYGYIAIPLGDIINNDREWLEERIKIQAMVSLYEDEKYISHTWRFKGNELDDENLHFEITIITTME